MKILLVIDSLKFGGAQRQLVELIKGLQNTNHYTIKLIYLNNESEGYLSLLEKRGIDLTFVQRKYKFDIITPILKIRKIIRKERIEIIHTFMNMGSFFGGFAAKLSLKPVICSAIRDANDTSSKEKWLIRIIAIYSNILVANSKAGFLNRFKKMRSKFKVVYNGMDFSRFTHDYAYQEELKNEFKLYEFKYVVSMVASLNDYKDHIYLLKAIPSILKSFPKTLFLLIGDGKNRVDIERIIVEDSLEKNVILTGYREDVDHFYPLSDLSVLLTNTKIIFEGISNSLTEAMANGVPVIASAGGGTDELIQDSKTGFILKSNKSELVAKKIIDLLSDYEKIKTIGLNGKKDVYSRFNIERYIKEYEVLYYAVLKSSRDIRIPII